LKLLSNHLVLAVEQPLEPSSYLDLASGVVASLLLEVLEDVLGLGVVGLAT
jgi:hypothetical protein